MHISNSFLILLSDLDNKSSSNTRSSTTVFNDFIFAIFVLFSPKETAQKIWTSICLSFLWQSWNFTSEELTRNFAFLFILAIDISFQKVPAAVNHHPPDLCYLGATLANDTSDDFIWNCHLMGLVCAGSSSSATCQCSQSYKQKHCLHFWFFSSFIAIFAWSVRHFFQIITIQWIYLQGRVHQDQIHLIRSIRWCCSNHHPHGVASLPSPTANKHVVLMIIADN